MAAQTIVLQFDPTPRPISCYAELWGKKPVTLSHWCAKGWVPGAFMHPCGEWWVRPLELLNFEPGEVEAKDNEEIEADRKRGADKGQVLRPSPDRWQRRLRQGT